MAPLSERVSHLGSVRLRDGLGRVVDPLNGGYQRLTPDVTMITVDGVTANFDTSEVCLVGPDFRRDLESERPVISRYLADLRDDDVVFDVGAGVGVYACFAAEAMADGTVIAFEPHPDTATRLRSNAAHNGGIEISGLALSAERGHAILATERNPTTDPPGDGDERPGLQTVGTVTGDELVSETNLPSPTVVRVDVGGGEGRVLDGLSETLAEHVRVLYLEIHERRVATFGDSPGGIFESLADLGFDVERLVRRRDTVFVRARKR